MAPPGRRLTLSPIGFDIILALSQAPGGLRLAELAHASERLFEIRSLVNDRHDYSTTCAEWLRRLRSRRAEAEEIAGADVTEAYERYLEASIRQFDREHLVLYRILLRKVATT